MSSNSDERNESHATGEMAQLIQEQVQRLSLSIGRGLDASSIQTAASSLAAASPHKDYVKFQHMEFIYEKLDGHNVNNTVQSLVDEWIDVGVTPIHSTNADRILEP